MKPNEAQSDLERALIYLTYRWCSIFTMDNSYLTYRSCADDIDELLVATHNGNPYILFSTKELSRIAKES